MNYRIKTRPKIPRNKYGYLAPSSTGGGGAISTTNIENNGNSDFATEANHATEADHALSADTANKLTKSVKLWGNTFDGTQDLNGDITTEGGLNIGNDSFIHGDTYIDGVTSTGDVLYGHQGAMFVKGDDEEDSYIILQDTTTPLTTIANLTPTEIDYHDSTGNKSGTIKIKNGEFDNINGGDAILSNLTVTGSAHFFELIIDQIKSVGGAALFTPADGFTIDKVTPIINDSYNRYRLYWKNTDGDGNVRHNMWKRGDQALCMTFNKATSTQTDNKYYWCYVPWTSNDETNPPTDGYNFIDIVVDESGTPKADGVVNPEIGDNIVMCGHRKYGNETDIQAAERGSAIYISAYNGLDTGIKAPFIAQYKAIKTFSLTPYRQSYFDATGAKFVGDFTISQSQMQEIISQVSDGTAPYISDGTDGFTVNHWIVWDSTNKRFKDSGILAQGTNGTSVLISSSEITYQIGNNGNVTPTGTWSTTIPSLIQGKYLWTKTVVNYTDGTKTVSYSVAYISEDSISYKLYPIIEQAIVKTNENLDITLDYLAYQEIGGTQTAIQLNTNKSGWYVTIKDNVSTVESIIPNGKLNYTYLTNYFTNKKTDVRSFTIKLYNNTELKDSRTIQVVFEPSATFEVNQELNTIKSRVTQTESDIDGIDSRVSEVEQTASAITSTVRDIRNSVKDYNLLKGADFCDKVKNYPYFSNGGYNTYITSREGKDGVNAYKCTTAYYDNVGVYWGRNHGENIKVNIGSTYTISVWIKSDTTGNQNFYVEYCGHNTADSTTRQKYNQFKPVIIGNDYKQYSCTFVAEYPYYEINMYANKTSVSPTSFICQPMLVEGTEILPFYKETHNTIEGNLIDNCDSLIVGGNLNEANGNLEGSAIKTLVSSPNNYDILLRWDLGTGSNIIQPHRNYTFSFWAKASTQTELITLLYSTNSYIINYCESEFDYNIASESYMSYGNNRLQIGTDWKLYTVRYETVDNIVNPTPSTKRLIIRFNGNLGTTVWIKETKFEYGMIPSDFTSGKDSFENSTDYLQSQITQTADNITLNVSDGLNKTGIDITNNTIKLNAENTIVNNNLSVGSLQTMGNNATITINEGQLKVFGNNQTQPNIVFGIDDNGYAVLSYYDNDGTLLYNLGPQGIFNTFGTVESKFLPYTKYLKADSSTQMLNALSSIDVAANGTNYYQFKEGYQWISQGKVKRYAISGTDTPSLLNDNYYDSNRLGTNKQPTGSRISNGVYLSMMQVMQPDESDTNKILIGCYFEMGKLIKTFNVYYTYINSTWRLADTNFKIVTNKTYIQYLELTGQNNIQI